MRKKGYDGSIHYLDQIGFLSPRVQAAHMVWLDGDEIQIAAASGMGMSWTLTIMMACHSYAKIDKLIESGITIGFGTDCFSMDVLEELRYATYSANFVRGDEGFQLKAFELLRMATLGGARALGLDSEIGSLEVGKRADLIVLQPRRRPAAIPKNELLRDDRLPGQVSQPDVFDRRWSDRLRRWQTSASERGGGARRRGAGRPRDGSGREADRSSNAPERLLACSHTSRLS